MYNVLLYNLSYNLLLCQKWGKQEWLVLFSTFYWIHAVFEWNLQPFENIQHTSNNIDTWYDGTELCNQSTGVGGFVNLLWMSGRRVGFYQWASQAWPWQQVFSILSSGHWQFCVTSHSGVENISFIKLKDVLFREK